MKNLKDAQDALEKMKDASGREKFVETLDNGSWLFCAEVGRFLKNVGGYVWLSDKINEMGNQSRREYISAITAVKSWADTIYFNINNKREEIA